MSFDFGDVITRAARITWKNKVLWLFSALPVLMGIVIFPIFFVPVLIFGDTAFQDPTSLNAPVYGVIFFALSLLISVLSVIVYGISSASVTLGALRADGNQDTLSLTTGELFTEGRKYWWRVLGVVLLISLAVTLVFLVLFGCMALFGAVTMGLGVLCIQPLFILMYPLMLVLYGYMEEAQVAVVVDDLGVMDALKRAWDLLKANFWSIALLSLLVYLIIGFLSALAIMPFMLPFAFLFPFILDNQQAAPDFRTMMLLMGGMNCVILPIMAVVQGVSITFMKSTFLLAYLRLTGKPAADNSQPQLDDNPSPPVPPEPENENNQTLIAKAPPEDANKTVIAKRPDA